MDQNSLLHDIRKMILLNRTRYKTSTENLTPRPLIKAAKGSLFVVSKKYYRDIQDYANRSEKDNKDDLLKNDFKLRYLKQLSGREIMRHYEIDYVFVDENSITHVDDDLIYYLYRFTGKGINK